MTSETQTVLVEQIDRLCDRVMDWKWAALRVGEELASLGPSGYYAMEPDEWRDWCLAAIAKLKETR